MATRPWVQIADALRREITSSAVPGSRLPSGRELMERFGVARNTVQNAIDQLMREGLVESVAGRGWFVSERRPLIRVDRTVLGIAGWGEGLCEPGTAVRVYRRSCPAEIAALLEVDPGSDVVVRDQVLGDGAGVEALVTHYLPIDVAAAAELERTDLGDGGLHARIVRACGDLSGVTELVTARPPRPQESELLHLAAGVPVLEAIRVACIADRPVEATLTIMSGARFQLAYRIELPAAGTAVRPGRP